MVNQGDSYLAQIGVGRNANKSKNEVGKEFSYNLTALISTRNLDSIQSHTTFS